MATIIQDWLHLSRYPTDVLVVAISEEYGYRSWLWVYPGTIESLRADWLRGHAPTNFFDPSIGNYEGTMVEVVINYNDDVRDASFEPVWDAARKMGLYAHVHEPEDTFLDIHGEHITRKYTRSTP